MRIAIIILNFNSSADCKKCIGSLKKQEDQEAEIIVVDNCSEQEDRCVVEQLCQKEGCTFIANSKNLGYNAGNNVGLQYAASKGYEYTLIANPDMEFPQNDYLQKMRATMEIDKAIAVCGSDIVTPTGIHQNPKRVGEGKWQDSFSWVKDIFRKRNTTEVPDWIEAPEKSRYCRCLNGCCILLRMSFVKEVGYFDERTFLYGEEPILARQVEMSGNKMYYNASAQAVHDHKKSKEGTPAYCSKHWKHSQLLYIRHYSGYPVWGKIYAELSTHLYFAALNIYHKIRKSQKWEKELTILMP